jgi:hypothetical protein
MCFSRFVLAVIGLAWLIGSLLGTWRENRDWAWFLASFAFLSAISRAFTTAIG